MNCCCAGGCYTACARSNVHVANGRRYGWCKTPRIQVRRGKIALEQKKDFADSDQMEIVDYGERILCIQRGRETAFTAFFHCTLDDRTVRWAKTTKVDGEFITEITTPASLNPKQNGQHQFLTMLSKTSSDLGRDFPKFDEAECSEKLTVWYMVGQGATATVYAAKLGGLEGVAKVMKHGFKHLADHEKPILDRLQLAGVPGVLSNTKISHGVLFFNQSTVATFHGNCLCRSSC